MVDRAGGTLLGLVVGIVRFCACRCLPCLPPSTSSSSAARRCSSCCSSAISRLPALLGYRTTAYRAASSASSCSSAPISRRISAPACASVRPASIQAALATGLTRWQVLRLIVLPHAIRRVLPSLFNQYVRLIKFTSVASVIGVTELTGAGLLINARDFHPVTILATIAHRLSRRVLGAVARPAARSTRNSA